MVFERVGLGLHLSSFSRGDPRQRIHPPVRQESEAKDQNSIVVGGIGFLDDVSGHWANVTNNGNSLLGPFSHPVTRLASR